MDANAWIERLYADEGIAGSLGDEHAQILLSWTESQLSVCETDSEAQHLLDSVRLLARYVAAGGSFDQLLAALKTSMLPRPLEPGSADPETFDPTTAAVYPPEP